MALMPYAVRAISASGFVTWLTGTRIDGFRSTSVRESAEVFPTMEGAKGAIDNLPRAFKDTGIWFSIQKRMTRADECATLPQGSHAIYEPTQEEIAAECAKIRAEKEQRLANEHGPDYVRMHRATRI
jgi:hypothetical protein